MNSVAKRDLVTLDGKGVKKLSQQKSLVVFELLEERCNLRPLIVASQIPPKKLRATIKDPIIAEAIGDRLINNSHEISINREIPMKGISYGLTEVNNNI